MKKAIRCPLEDRREFALWAHAVICFENCAAACDRIIRTKLSPIDPLFKPLTAWAVIEYAKPFTKSQTFGRLPAAIIDGHEKLHAFIMSLRDKVVAHLDTKGLSDDQPIHHHVRIAFKESGTETIVEEPKVNPQVLPDLRSLATLLAEKASYHAKRKRLKITQAVKRARTGQGEYLIDVKHPTDGLRKVTVHRSAVPRERRSRNGRRLQRRA